MSFQVYVQMISVEPNQTLSTSISSPSPTPLDEIMINSDQRRIDFLLLRK